MFQPAIPLDGLAGWRLLQRTFDTQLNAFTGNAQIQRDTEYFRDNIATVTSATELVADRRLLSVALGAFGLQDDINNKYFIQKMLDEGTTNSDSFANRFADPRYRELSAAFGFGPGELRLNKLSGFADRMIDDFERQSFEVAVGEQSDTMRIALNAEREFEKLSFSQASEAGKWFSIMGNPPMRNLFQTVFQLPSSFSQIDIDRQQEMLSDRSDSLFGTRDPADFNDPDLQDELITRFTALSQLESSNSNQFSAASNALTLLRGF